MDTLQNIPKNNALTRLIFTVSMVVMALCLAALALIVVLMSGYSDALPVGFAIGGCIAALALYLLYVGFSKRHRENISDRLIVILVAAFVAAAYLFYTRW
jgi:hypothetical protein